MLSATADPRTQPLGGPGPVPNGHTDRPSSAEAMGTAINAVEPHGPPLTPVQLPARAQGRRPSTTNTTSTSLAFTPHSSPRRQQTAPSLSSPLRISTPTAAPARGHSRTLSDMSFTGDKRPSRQREKSPGRGDQSEDDSTSSAETATSPDTASGSQPATTPDSGTSPASAQSRFGFLSALTNRWNHQPVITPQVEEELLSMNVETALYPSGSPDAFSPAAYKNLQANATGLLLKMQTAYRQRTTALQDMQAERSAEKEETEEARLRVDHLKMQLEHMASQAVEQEHAMKQLMDELKAERKARRGEQLAREKILAEGSVVSEDLGVDEEERKKWRKSGSTIKSDVSFDTDEESAESESVFSRSRSPTLTTSATEILDAPSPQGANTPTLSLPPKPKFGKEMSTFQKLMKGISGDSTNDDGRSGGCKSCKGQDSTRAWDTVSVLRDENKDLKQRMAQLEVAVEGALDLVNGIGVRP